MLLIQFMSATKPGEPSGSNIGRGLVRQPEPGAGSERVQIQSHLSYRADIGHPFFYGRVPTKVRTSSSSFRGLGSERRCCYRS
jgi:hypothetical protein